MNTNSSRFVLAFLIAALGLFALDLGLRRATAPPAARGLDTPAGEFSADRALAFHERVFDARAPHPLGSVEHARLRERLIEELAKLGAEAVVEEHEVLRGTTLARVQNVVVAPPANREKGCVLVCAHYDSVAAGPGAGDDGAGVAAMLEVVRALRAAPAAGEHPVLFFFDDGEELGLLGARAFLEQSAYAKDVAVVVNLEARGTRGPSRMFETSIGNAELIDHCAALPHPSASSISYEVYRRMPNDTDLSEFKRAGLPGVNFAFVGGGRRYHTPLDDREHLDPDTLQHHGENALAVVRSLAAQPGAFEKPGERGDAVYTDLAGLVLVRWPGWSAPWIAMLLLLAVGHEARGAIRAAAATRAELVRGALLALLAPLLALAFAWCADALVTQGRTGVYSWPPESTLARSVVILAGVAGCAWAAVSALPGANGRARGLGLGVALVHGIAGLIVALFVPGASYAFALPMLAAVVAGFKRPAKAMTALVVLGAIVWLPFFAAIEEVFELRTRDVPAAVALAVGWAWFSAPLALFLTTAARRVRGALALVLVAFLTVAAFATRAAPERSPDEPEPVFLARVERQGESTAHLCLRSFGAGAVGAGVLESWLDERGFTNDRVTAVPWWPRSSGARRLSVPSANLAAPETRVVSSASFTLEDHGLAEGERAVELVVASRRGARALAVELPKGVTLRAMRTARGERTRLALRGLVHVLGFEREEVTLLLGVESSSELELGVLDVDTAEDAPVAELLRALPAGFAPIGEGVVSIAERRVRL